MSLRIFSTMAMLAVLWGLAIPPAAAAGTPFQVSTNIFGQLVGYQLPQGFVPAFENASDRSYIQESVLQGETVDAWSQMITLTSEKGLAADPSRTPVWLANVFGEGYRKNCPDTYLATAIQETRVENRDAFVAYFGCGTVSSAPEARSEVVTVIFIRAGDDFLTLQWAERGQATKRQIPLDVEKWKARMARLFPLMICDIDKDKGCGP